MLFQRLFQTVQHFLVGHPLRSRADNRSRSLEEVFADNGLKCTNGANPVAWIISDMTLLQIELIAVPDLVPDVLFICEKLTHESRRPASIQTSFDPARIEVSRDFRLGLPFADKTLEDLVYNGNLIIRPRHQGDAICLNALVFATRQDSLGIARFIN